MIFLSEISVRRTDSIQSRRKVSSISDRSDTSEPGAASGGEESPGILRYGFTNIFIFVEFTMSFLSFFQR